MSRTAATVALLLLACAAPARADEPAPADTSLGRYLESMSDSTAERFGAVAAPIDTVGLDSARVYSFSHPDRWKYKREGSLALYPVLDFNRVDGPAMGAGAAIGTAAGWGRLSGQWADATGPNLSLGSGRYLIEGLRFHMPGAWVVGFRIKAGSVIDAVNFDLQLD